VHIFLVDNFLFDCFVLFATVFIYEGETYWSPIIWRTEKPSIIWKLYFKASGSWGDECGFIFSGCCQ